MKKYILTRFLTPSHLIAAIGIAYSGQMINGGTFSFINFLVSLVGILLFFFVVRVDDDIQDIAKDKIAHPNQIAVRKFLLQDIEKYVWRTCIVFSIFLFMVLWKSGFYYAITLLYFWLQRKPFRQPLLKHFITQGMIIPVGLFASEMGSGVSVAYAMVLFGAFSTYEICRKLDPFAHPVILSLLQFYGFREVYWIVVGQVLVSAIGAYYLDSYLILWPVEMGVLYILSRLFQDPRQYKFAQLAAAISLFIHIWFC